MHILVKLQLVMGTQQGRLIQNQCTFFQGVMEGPADPSSFQAQCPRAQRTCKPTIILSPKPLCPEAPAGPAQIPVLHITFPEIPYDPLSPRTSPYPVRAPLPDDYLILLRIRGFPILFLPFNYKLLEGQVLFISSLSWKGLKP